MDKTSITMKTGCVALVLCLNISVDPPDVIKISPYPFSMAAPKALETIGKTLHSQYERWQPKARYKLQLDPTLEETGLLVGEHGGGLWAERTTGERGGRQSG
uniref:Raptor N-terminal CASPase-like domain-containing protein n=1 Tax=Oryza nivara TaxID=4536 RepID=A0A0E0HCR5_ORYNI